MINGGLDQLLSSARRNQQSRKSLQVIISRLVLRKVTRAMSSQHRCFLCELFIRRTEEYRKSGIIIAHNTCITTVADGLKGEAS